METCGYYVMSEPSAHVAAEHPAALPIKSLLTRHADFPITPPHTAVYAAGSN